MAKQQNPQFEEAIQEILNPESQDTKNPDSFAKKNRSASQRKAPQSSSPLRKPSKATETIVRIIAALFVIGLLFLFAMQIAGR